MSPSSPAARSRYNSPLRQAQAEQTRDLIVDTFVTLLDERPAEDISMRELAEHAGVAERTVYRHFPSRQALRAALADRIESTSTVELSAMDSLDSLMRHLPNVFRGFDDDAANTRAAILVNSDPRNLPEPTRARSELWIGLAETSFPELSTDQARALGAITRLLLSSHTWLRLRDEFGYSGPEAAALVNWAYAAVLDTVRDGDPPPGV